MPLSAGFRKKHDRCPERCNLPKNMESEQSQFPRLLSVEYRQSNLQYLRYEVESQNRTTVVSFSFQQTVYKIKRVTRTPSGSVCSTNPESQRIPN